MADIHVHKVDETKVRLSSNDHGILMEISEHFTFFVDGYKFMKLFRNRMWDGKFRLFNIKNGILPYGLLLELLKFAASHNYNVILDSAIKERDIPAKEELLRYANSLTIMDGANKITPHHYQLDAFTHAISEGRSLIISPTGCLDGNTIVDAEISDGLISFISKHTFKELYDAYHAGKTIKLTTPDGPKRVIGAYIKYGPGLTVVFNDNTFFTGSVNHLVMRDNDFVKLSELKVGDVLTNKPHKITSINKVPPQEWYDFSLDYEKECYYQNDVIHHNSGKSLIIYMMIRWYLENYDDDILIIVPTTSLVAQMEKEFANYASTDNSFDAATDVHQIYSGKEKISPTARIIVSTWQSAIHCEKEWFTKFGMVVGDECIHPDSMVSMGDGSFKKISDIVEGESVKTFNESKKIIENNKVIKVHKNLKHSGSEKRYKILMEDGSSLIITGNHKVKTDKGWVETKNLTLEHKIYAIE